jgi:aerobic carbon-monoxide dehydrogenase medium subunit
MSLHTVKQFLAPTDSDQIIRLLETYGPRARVIGGGSFINYLDTHGLFPDAEILITTARADLARIHSPDGALVIGAGTALYRLLGNARLATPAFGAIRDAAESLVPQVRNMATVGGCVATASSLFDLPVALMALDGMVGVCGAGTEREVPLRDFARGEFKNALRDSEFVREVRLPQPPCRAASTFLKNATTANDFALISAAVYIEGEGDTCRESRIVVGGGVRPSASRASEAEAILKGKRLTLEAFNSAASAAAEEIQTMSDHRASARYRQRLVQVLVRRALELAAERMRNIA